MPEDPSDPTAASAPRVALVTGAGGAIGGAVAERLARRGVRVALNDIDGAALDLAERRIRSATGTECVAVVADVSRRAAVAALAQQVATTLGPVDILVNNAGVLSNA